MVYDCIGIRAGPSNIGAGITWQEMALGKSILLVDSSLSSSWYPRTHFDFASLQVNPLKDLVIQRNPCSEFSFINYLKVKGRLKWFINMGEVSVRRCEFSDYLEWVSEKLGICQYNSEVIRVENCTKKNSTGAFFCVKFKDKNNGKKGNLLCRGLSVAVGFVPNLPANALASHSCVLHSSSAMQRLEESFSDRQKAYRFLVIGGGQSAGELTLYLLIRYPEASITVASSGYLFRMVDNNPFVNDVYTDLGLPSISCQDSFTCDGFFAKDLALTNYGVVDAEILQRIAQERYSDELKHRKRLFLKSYHKFISMTNNNNEICCALSNIRTQEVTELKCDAVVMATGYKQQDLRKLFEPMSGDLLWADKKTVRTDENYCALTESGVPLPLFVHGVSSQMHGPAEGTLTNMAERSARIVTQMLKVQQETQSAFVSSI